QIEAAQVVGQVPLDTQNTFNQESTGQTTRAESLAASIAPRLAALAATLVLAAVGLWIVHPDAFSSLMQESDEAKGTLYLKTTQKVGENQQLVEEVWFDPEIGVLRKEGDDIWLSTDQSTFQWSQSDSEAEVIRRPSAPEVLETLGKRLGAETLPDDIALQRLDSLDKQIEGEACKASLLLEDSPEGTRVVVWVDNKRRVRRVCHEVDIENAWIVVVQRDFQYELDIEASVFQPKFDANRKIIDVQAIIESRFGLDEALQKKVKDGLLFAIHECKQVDEGCYFIVSSVRPTQQYLKKYPPTPQFFRPYTHHWQIATESGSHGSAGSNSQAVMMNASLFQTHYAWRLLILDDSDQPRNDAEEGKLSIPFFAHHYHEGRRRGGVLGNTSLDLTCPIEGETILEQVAFQVREDLDMLALVQGDAFRRVVNGAIKDNAMQSFNLLEATDQEYAETLQELRWQLTTNNWTGEAMPVGYAFPMPQVRKWVDPLAKFPNKPLQVPELVRGKVLSKSGMPIKRAAITLRIRRYGIDGQANTELSTTTDDEGEYEIKLSNEMLHPKKHTVEALVEKDGFAFKQLGDYELRILSGSIPNAELLPGKKMTLSLVDEKQEPVTKAVLRIQANDPSFERLWNSGPQSVDEDGNLEVWVPADTRVVAAVYPEGRAARFIEPNEEQLSAPEIALGNIEIEKGKVFSGQVLDQKGQGLASTVIGIRKTEYRDMFGVMQIIGQAVRTDEQGNYTLPPLAAGTYRLQVTEAAPVYAKQRRMVGPKPPDFDEYILDVGRQDPTSKIILRETEY
ncbi:MAG: carboxypeptidase-like regulatory domain-containing protein, partial [Planctomycetota bacterium]